MTFKANELGNGKPTLFSRQAAGFQSRLSGDRQPWPLPAQGPPCGPQTLSAAFSTLCWAGGTGRYRRAVESECFLLQHLLSIAADWLPLEPRAQLCLRWRSPQDALPSSRLALDTEGSVTALHLMLRVLSTYPDLNFVNSPLVKSS